MKWPHSISPNTHWKYNLERKTLIVFNLINCTHTLWVWVCLCVFTIPLFFELYKHMDMSAITKAATHKCLLICYIQCTLQISTSSCGNYSLRIFFSFAVASTSNSCTLSFSSLCLSLSFSLFSSSSLLYCPTAYIGHFRSIQYSLYTE